MEMTISTSPAGASSSTEKISYRQVADPRRPVYFLRNPSRVYGLANTLFAAEQAYESVTQQLKAENPDLPARLFRV